MKKIALLASLLALIPLASASAVEFSFSYIDTASSSTTLTGISTGDTVTITYVLDNGGSSLLGQTWDYSDLVSVTISSGTWSATIDYTGSETLSSSNGSFVTNASGTLTSVPISWYDNSIATGNYTTTDSATGVKWYVFGLNMLYYSSTGKIYLANVANDIVASYWTVSVVPEPGAYASFVGLVALGFVFLRRRKKA